MVEQEHEDREVPLAGASQSITVSQGEEAVSGWQDSSLLVPLLLKVME